MDFIPGIQHYNHGMDDRIKKLIKYLPFLSLVLILFVTRIFSLDRFVTTDEIAWFFRSGNFYYAVSHGEFAQTDFGPSIAVFTLWINSLAFLTKFPMFRGLGQGYLENYDPYWSVIFSNNNISELSVVAMGRLLMVLSLIVLALLIYWYLYRSVGTIPALTSSLFIALNPFYIALSRTSHLDAPMGTFLLVSILSYHAFVYQGKWKIDLVISGVSGGFSFLSKLPGLLVIPGVIGTSVLSIYTTYYKRIAHNGRIVAKQISMHLRYFIIWIIIFIVTIFILWPVMWVKPISVIKMMVYAPLSFSVIEEEVGNSEISPADQTSVLTILLGKSISTWSRFKSYTISFLWRTSPAVLFGFLACLGGYWFRMDFFRRKNTRILVQTLFMLILLFLFFASVSEKFSEKYITPVYLSMDILAGFGWFALLGTISSRLAKPLRNIVFVICFVLVFVYQSALVLDNFPYYFTYYNPLMGGSKRAGEQYFVGVGEGLDQAARFLNQLPNADKLKVHSWYGIGPFSFFFDGDTSLIATGITWSDDFIKRLKKSDYLVVYTNQWYRKIPFELFEILKNIEPINQVWLEDIEYARIYRIADIPLP